MISKISKLESIQKRINDVEEMTSWSPVPLGSILRAPAYSYDAWGISITSENSTWLYVRSSVAYMTEWGKTDQRLNDLVSKAAEEAGLGDVNALLNRSVGSSAAAFLLDTIQRKRHFAMIDIGAGTGPTSLATLDALNELMLANKQGKNWDYGKIILVEPSKDRISRAIETVEKSAFYANYGKRTQVKGILKMEISALKLLKRGSIDVAISNAAIHHNAFNYHLKALHSAIERKTGQFISGDWHDSMWHSPERAYWMIAAMSRLNDQEKIDAILGFIKNGKMSENYKESREAKEFREYFGIDIEHMGDPFSQLSVRERKANAGIFRFWISVGKAFSDRNEKSPIFMIEAHEPVSKRVENLNAAGFDVLRHEEISIKEGEIGELATVMRATMRQAD